MRQKRKSRTWLWILLVVVLAGVIGYFILSRNTKGPEEPLITERLASVETKVPSKEPKNTSDELERVEVEREVNSTGFTEEAPAPKSSHKEDLCAQVEKNITEFFRYLDQKQYVRNPGAKVDTYMRFKKILNRLAARPPVPAGEGIDPTIIIKNVYHFYRVLDRKDLQLIRHIVTKENETIEFNLEMFYRWVCLGNRCPDPEGMRPSKDMLYKYAGFFINTTGGRAYLFRRPSDIRLLVSYYCLLIINKADKKGGNSYGIDILPYIEPIREEILLHPHFHFQSEYINKLDSLKRYYQNKRKSF
ncbi:MAG: hypothetical protein B1H12_00995 [Desulfobacteraceae bacterium 4484_190.2]|nr:MAG: hypothetical protein B1H12_00995 [Desulfobacteraceae bacterium 4484_190.2]